MDDQNSYDEGLKVRREVLGDDYVERSLQRHNEFNAEFQEMITRYAWDGVWNRPGLDRRARSLITLSMLIALNRDAEFRLHIRAAHTNGVTREEIKELLLQSAIYCGVPAANGAFHAAQQVFDEMDREAGGEA